MIISTLERSERAFLATWSDQSLTEYASQPAAAQYADTFVHELKRPPGAIFSRDGSKIFTGSERPVSVWDLASRKAIANLKPVPLDCDEVVAARALGTAFGDE